MSDQALTELIECWKTSPEPSLKVNTYFPVYARLFQHLRGTPCVFVETGVLDGGSLFMWRKWLGERARIVGIDLNPDVKKWEKHGFEIHIGDQGDPAFWRDTLAKIGRFDVLLDDGGHKAFQQIVTVREALRAASSPCTIAIEDTYTSFMYDFDGPSKDSFLEYAKAATDLLAGRAFGMYPHRFPRARNGGAIASFASVASIEFFSGIVCFHVDPARATTTELVTNQPAKGASDFRHRGKTSAQVDWPNVLHAERRVVGDGGLLKLPRRKLRGALRKVRATLARD